MIKELSPSLKTDEPLKIGVTLILTSVILSWFENLRKSKCDALNSRFQGL
jgi:hypothetical protein